MSTIDKLKNKYKDLEGAKLIIGPSKEDHNELLKISKFYNKAFKKKIYSFTSDIWRAWAIKKYGSGLYIDSSVEIDVKKLNSFISRLKNKGDEFVGFLENPTKIASCVFYCNEESKILDDYLYYYSTYKFLIKYFKIAPEIITKAVHVNCGHESSKTNTRYNNIKLFTIKEIVSPEGVTGIVKKGAGSWTKKPGSREQYWIRKAKQFDTGFTQKEIKHYIKSDLKRGLWKLRNR